MRYRIVAALVGSILALGVAAPAAAGQLERGHYSDSGSEPTAECAGLGIDLIYSWDYSGSFVGYIGKDSLIHYRWSENGTNDFLNVATGKSYVQQAVFNGHDISVTDNGDGTLTIIFQGVSQERWYDGDGKMVLRLAGMFRDELLVDHGGTPGDPADDVFSEGNNIKSIQQTDPFIGRDFCEDVLLFTD